MNDVNKICVTRDWTMHDALAMLDKSGAGLLLLVGDDGRFERTVTDGDLRRLLLKGVDMGATIADLPEIHSLTIGDAASRKEVLSLMDTKGVNHCARTNANIQLASESTSKTNPRQAPISTESTNTPQLIQSKSAMPRRTLQG